MNSKVSFETGNVFIALDKSIDKTAVIISLGFVDDKSKDKWVMLTNKEAIEMLKSFLAFMESK